MSSAKFDVVTLGHALVDIRIVVERFPGPDEESPVINQTWGAGGSAVNTAIGVRRLGMRSAIIAKIGFDTFGRIIVDELLAEGVDISGLRVSSTGRTGLSIVAIDSGGNIAIYGFKGVAEDLSPEEVDREIIQKSRFLHIASLRLDTSISAARIAKSAGVKVSWDPGRVLARKGLSELKEMISLADIVLVNEHESKLITGEEDYRRAAKIIRDHGASVVAVKRGAKGVYVLSEGLEDEVPAMRVGRAVDTTGAGDAFAAGLITGLLRGYSLRKAVLYANAVAAMKIAKLGSHEVPRHEEVVDFLWEMGLS